MKTIYTVEIGRYEDVHICATYTREQDAEKAANFIQEKNPREYVAVGTLPLDFDNDKLLYIKINMDREGRLTQRCQRLSV